VLLVGIHRQPIGEVEALGHEAGAAIGAHTVDEAVARALGGARAVIRRVAAPDIAGAVDERVVRGLERLARDLVAQHLDRARPRVQPLEPARIGRVQREVGDEDTALAVHGDAIGAAARLAHASQPTVGQDLGAGARLV
jgi:hypothetical protein